ncbi:hypothetical protein ES703_105160 [subsurface metagenome]
MTDFEEARELMNAELERRRKSGSRPFNEGQLADALSISRSWFSRIMTEEKLKVTHLLKVAEILGIEPGSLLPRTHDPEPGMSLEQHLWFIIKKRLDEHIDEKLKKINKEVKK